MNFVQFLRFCFPKSYLQPYIRSLVPVQSRKEYKIGKNFLTLSWLTISSLPYVTLALVGGKIHAVSSKCLLHNVSSPKECYCHRKYSQYVMTFILASRYLAEWGIFQREERGRVPECTTHIVSIGLHTFPDVITQLGMKGFFSWIYLFPNSRAM